MIINTNITKEFIYEFSLCFLSFLVGFFVILANKPDEKYPSDIVNLDEGKYLRMVYIGDGSDNEGFCQQTGCEARFDSSGTCEGSDGCSNSNAKP